MVAGAYIDDTGTPGVKAASSFLHGQRKTWAALIVPEIAVTDLRDLVGIFLEGVQQDYGAKELHFTDVYGGRGEFRDVPIEDRFKLFELMVGVVLAVRTPILVQTLSPEFVREIRSRGFPFEGQIGFLNLSNHEHLALFFLLSQVRGFMRANKRHFPRPIPVFVDEGMVKPGNTLSIPLYQDVFRAGQIKYATSHQTPFLQLADFAAFVVGRTQWLVARGNLKERDHRFLRIVSPLHKLIMNLPAVEVDPSKAGPDSYDQILIDDRRRKGLPDRPSEP